MSDILVVGSLAYDTIQTPVGKAERTLGGSANYFSLAASLYSKVRVVGVVGDDYAEQDLAMLQTRAVCTAGLQRQLGKTFHWSGRYDGDMNEAKTLATELNVFECFNPQMPQGYETSRYVFLANIDPVLQLQVLSQVQSPVVMGSDTMNYWIKSKRQQLLEVLKRVDVLLINEGESKLLTGAANAIAASAEIMNLGPKAVVVKRGEYGFVMRQGDSIFALPAFPVANVVDPTGAGDTFAGAFFGYLAKMGNGLDAASLRSACVHGCLLASYTVEAFGVTRLRGLTWSDVEARMQQYLQMIKLG